MRLFTAIEIPAGVKDNLRALLERLRPLAKLNWTREDNLHITTKFIGEWPEARLDDLKRAIAGVGSRGSLRGSGRPIGVSIRGTGWFPNARHPRVLWAGVMAGEDLRQLAHATEDAVAAIGVPKEDRQYSPHLTLARIRADVPPEDLRKVEVLRKALDSPDAASEPAEFGSFRATGFYLYLSAAGEYTKLAEFQLTGDLGCS